ncbi:MAG: MATE family efflux transporter [Clostridia bacterium]|nr:MATE family efflux transporter [Clostridia bacterium]
MVIDKKLFYGKLIRLALPIALQSLMLASVAAADALMLGQVTQNQMTAVSQASQIQFIQNMFLFSLTGAGTLLGAQYWGKGDTETIRKIFNIMLRVGGIISVVFFLGCELVPDLLMRIFTHDDALIVIGVSYLRIAGVSYLLTGISQCYLAVMKVTEHVTPSAIISSAAVVLNILLNAVLIFGLFGIPRMEAIGAATATTIARTVELILCVAVSLRPSYLRPDIKRFFARYKGLTRDFMIQLLPLIGGSTFWGIGFTAYTAVLGHMGTDAAASNSVAAVIRDLICCMCNGVGSAAAIMVGNELGAGKLELGKAYGIKLMKISFVLGFISTGIVLALTPVVVNSVVLTEEARSYLTGMMVIMAVYMVGRSFNTVTINGVFTAGGDTKFDMYSLAVCMWGVAIPLSILGAFVLGWPVLAVYACTCLDEVGKIPWVLARFRKYKWVRNLTRDDL